MRNGLHLDQALPDEVFDIGPHSAFVGAIGELRQVLLSNRAKLADFNHRRDFRGPETIGPAPDFADVARPRRASCAGIGMGTCPPWARSSLTLSRGSSLRDGCWALPSRSSETSRGPMNSWGS